MIFKRPKTSNNFGFYYDEIGGDEYDENSRKEEEFDIEWNNTFENQIYFWYLMQIFELYDSKSEDLLSLSNIGEVEGYTKTIKKYDENVWNEYSLWDILFFQETYSILLYRISDLTRLFFAFDIKRISMNGYIDNFAKDFIRSFLSGFEKISEIEDEDYDILYGILGEFGKIDDVLSSRRLTKMLKPRTFEEDRPFYGDTDEFEIYPKTEDGFLGRGAKWEMVSHFGKYLDIEIEFDKSNMEKLRKLIDIFISDGYDTQDSGEMMTREFIKIAKQSEIIGNTVFIKFQDAIESKFPLLQYLYWLSKNEGSEVISWHIKDVFAVKLFDPTICHILGIGTDTPKQQENIGKLSYNEKKEALELSGKKLGLGVNNEGFIKEYFDLMFEFESGVSIDDIVERLEPNIWELGAEAIPKKKKSLSYDRVNLLNKKIAKLTGITGLFKIENGYIKLTSEIRVEK